MIFRRTKEMITSLNWSCTTFHSAYHTKFRFNTQLAHKLPLLLLKKWHTKTVKYFFLDLVQSFLALFIHIEMHFKTFTCTTTYFSLNWTLFFLYSLITLCKNCFNVIPCTAPMVISFERYLSTPHLKLDNKVMQCHS